MDWQEALEKCRCVEIGFQGHPTLVAGSPPASPAMVDSVRELAGDFVPEEYLSLLRITDGLFLIPWDEDGAAGVELFSVAQLGPAHELAEETATAGDPRYFAVGRLHSAASDFIAVDVKGAVWWLMQGAGPGDWETGYGSRRICESLVEFVSRLADARGAWWWLPGFESEGT
jgi:hypothetical protein